MTISDRAFPEPDTVPDGAHPLPWSILCLDALSPSKLPSGPQISPSGIFQREGFDFTNETKKTMDPPTD